MRLFKFRLLVTLFAAAALCAVTMGCHRLSEKARQMPGHYYINEISQDLPLLELNDDATCIVRAIKPGTLTSRPPTDIFRGVISQFTRRS